MAELLQPIAIDALEALPEGRRWSVDQALDDFASLSPVEGWIEARVEGPLLRVVAQASTTVALRCDRCLQTYAQPLQVKASERLALGTSSDALDEALAFDADDISEQIDPAGSFDPRQWLYEQLCLQLPTVNRCGSSCPGPASWGSDGAVIDPRWAALKRLQP